VEPVRSLLCARKIALRASAPAASLSHHLVAVTIKINPFVFSERFLKKLLCSDEINEIKLRRGPGLLGSWAAHRRCISRKLNDFRGAQAAVVGSSSPDSEALNHPKTIKK
jgi:hypothetical protein